ncbi:MAG: NAD(P)-dependent alcohol dehydrogenase [Hyphomonadaceae bacterium]
MQIQAAVAWEREKPFSIETVELDEPRDDEILVRIKAVGLCHTDLMVRDVDTGLGMNLPAVLGHEGSGVVERVGASVRKVKVGDHVALSFMSCGTCRNCQEGRPAYCTTMAPLNFCGRRCDGSATMRAGQEELAANFFGQSSFATFALTHERNTVVVPRDAPLEIVGPLGCGIQTGAGAIINSLACEAGSSLLVVGGGSVGLSAVLAGVVQGCSPIIIVEPHEARRRLALDLGGTHAIDPGAGDIAAAVRAIVPEGVRYAFDTSGRDEAIEGAIGALGVLGAIALVAGSGLPTQRLPATIPAIVGGALTIKGVIEGSSDPDTFIPYMLRLHREGKFPFERLIKTFPFADINKAVEAQHRGEAVKVVLMMP